MESWRDLVMNLMAIDWSSDSSRSTWGSSYWGEYVCVGGGGGRSSSALGGGDAIPSLVLRNTQKARTPFLHLLNVAPSFPPPSPQIILPPLKHAPQGPSVFKLPVSFLSHPENVLLPQTNLTQQSVTERIGSSINSYSRVNG